MLVSFIKLVYELVNNYKVVGIDLAKKKFHFAGLDINNKVVFKKSMSRDNFLHEEIHKFDRGTIFAFEACGVSNYLARYLTKHSHLVEIMKPKDVKAYAKLRQKNDINDAIAICKTALDPDLKKVQPKTVFEQEVAYIHKSRQNTIRQRIQRSNSLISSLLEFGYIVSCGKAKFAQNWLSYLNEAKENSFISKVVYEQMLLTSS